jgi:thiopeptide-type bacteriocin biosynthesis protein
VYRISPTRVEGADVNREYWLSAHVYRYGAVYGSAGDDTILDLAAPVFERCRRAGWIERFFFVRYLEGGPHVRLRFSGSRQVLEERIRPLLVERARSLLQRHEGGTTHHAAALDHVLTCVVKAGRFRPDGACEFNAYVPETERYGGPEGRRVAERHFFDSSRTALTGLAVLRRMVSGGPVPSSARLGLGYSLLACFVRALASDAAEARGFLEQYQGGYLQRVPAPVVPVVNAAYEHAFISNEARLRRQAGYRRVPPGSFLSSLHCEWYRSSKRALACLERLAAAGRLAPPHPALAGEARRSRHHIAASLLHMTNNRLGITIPEEAYLAFLLRRAIESNAADAAAPSVVPMGIPA